MNSITLKDFQPVNNWKNSTISETLRVDTAYPESAALWILVDQTTGKHYLSGSFNDSPDTYSSGSRRGACFGLALISLPIHLIASIVIIGYRILKFASLYAFWQETDENNSGLKNRFIQWLKDVKDFSKSLTLPIISIIAEISALYGILRPKDGAKLYASCERYAFPFFLAYAALTRQERGFLAPCFQPFQQRPLPPEPAPSLQLLQPLLPEVEGATPETS